jgi:hypothetical protein
MPGHLSHHTFTCMLSIKLGANVEKSNEKREGRISSACMRGGVDLVWGGGGHWLNKTAN